MSIRKKKLKKKRIANFKASIFLVIALVLLGGMFALNHRSSSIRERTDENFCRSDYLPEIKVILIDNTDGFDPIQKEELRKYLLAVGKSVKKGGLIALYSVGSSENNILKPEFLLCNPGSEDDLENSLTRQASLTKRNYNSHFTHGLEAELEKSMSADEANTSPIMQSIKAIYATQFSNPERYDTRKTLILVSDLLENTKGFSMLSGVPTFKNYRLSNHWQNTNVNLENVDVKILMIRREKFSKLQKRSLQNFWETFFEEQGAQVTRFDPI